MTDPSFYLAMAAAGLAGLTILTLAGLSGWRGWLTLQGEQLHRLGEPQSTGLSANARIEIADLRERIRKLEAIAAGVDL
jgi:hypothetical protein